MLETLAIVAYRQPVTRAVVERVRGVDSDYVLRALLHRRLVVEQGRAPTPGRPFLYGTGYTFLERFGLATLDDLPLLDADIAARLQGAESGDGAAQEGDVISRREAPGVEGPADSRSGEVASGAEDGDMARGEAADALPDATPGGHPHVPGPAGDA
jgi:hypothetical protein